MEDLRQEIEELNELADSQREKKARISGKIDMLEKSLKKLGLSAKTAKTEMIKLKRALATDNRRLKNMIIEMQDKYADRFQK